MKGIILAGGKGTRLYPLTLVVNKHFLAVYNKPMIYYPISLLMLAKIREILIVCNPEDLKLYKTFFLNGEHLGVKIDYVIQEQPKGISHGILLTEKYVGNDSVCVVLGDNLFFGHGLPQILLKIKKDVEKNAGSYVLGYYVLDPQRYGVIEFDKKGNVVAIKEKPKNTKSNIAVVGLYFYDNTVFDKIKKLKPSFRGELEVSSLNNLYLKEKKLKVELLGRGFAWFDMGTYHSFLEASEFVYTIEKRTGLMVGCIEEIAYRNGWITKNELKKLAAKLDKTDYGKYLLNIVNEQK